VCSTGKAVSANADFKFDVTVSGTNIKLEDATSCSGAGKFAFGPFCLTQSCKAYTSTCAAKTAPGNCNLEFVQTQILNSVPVKVCVLETACTNGYMFYGAVPDRVCARVGASACTTGT
jgi:hypothetical protein